MNTWGQVTLCGGTHGKFNLSIITQGRDKVYQGKDRVIHGTFNLVKYKYLGRVTLGKVNWEKIIQGINS